MPRRTLNNFATRDTGTVFETFDTSTGTWDGAGTGSYAKTSAVLTPSGGQSLALTVAAGVASYSVNHKSISPALDFSALADTDLIGCWVYFPRDVGSTASPANIDNVYLFLVSDATAITNYFQWQDATLRINNHRTKGWHFVGAPKSQWTSAGAPNWASIQQIRVQVRNGSAAAATCYFSDMVRAPRKRATLMLSTDDGKASIYTQFYAILAAQGLVGTQYVTQANISDYGGTGASLAQLVEMYDAGFDISNHYMTHTPVSSFTDPLNDARTQIGGCSIWLESLGFSRSARHVAYVGDSHTIPVIQVLRDELGMLTGRKANQTYNTYALAHSSLSQTVEPADLWHIPCYELGHPTSLATAKGYIDTIVSRCADGFVYTHDLVTTPTLGTQWGIADFTDLAAYIKRYVSLGLLDVLTISEWYDRRTRTRLVV